MKSTDYCCCNEMYSSTQKQHVNCKGSSYIQQRRFVRGGTLARTLQNKCLIDEELSRIDRTQWYQVDQNFLSSAPEVQDRFVQLSCDEETEAFLSTSHEKSEWVFTQLWHSLCKLLLGWFFTATSLNGFLGRGSMFVFSTQQLSTLLDVNSSGRRFDSLLDLGAGDGAVTAKMSPLFHSTSVTEVSPTMRSALSRRGYRVLGVDNWMQAGPWSVISCLNVLDRCARPRQLLADIRSALGEDGVAILALVLPYKPYVEMGGKGNHQPEELLPIRGKTFSEQASSFILNVLNPAGLQVLRWSRLPYLCEGDLHQAFYWLHDAVFVIKPGPIE